MKIDTTANMNFKAKFIVKDEAKLLNSCSKRLNNIAKLFEEKTSKYPNDSFTLLLNRYNDTSLITKIKKGNYKSLIHLKDNGLEELLANYNNDSIVKKFVKLFKSEKKCANLKHQAKNLIQNTKQSCTNNKYIETKPVEEFAEEAVMNIKANTVCNDKFYNEFVIKAMM